MGPIQIIDETLLDILLTDRTTQRNIIWGTSDYASYGTAYRAQFPIAPNLITGENKNVIQPRRCKERNDQTLRTKEKAEVFTPSWICNEQNNLIDHAWFGRKDVFNVQGNQTWTATSQPVEFEDKPGKRWRDYVDAKRLEITCGEAPYLVSRYDTVSGLPIKISERIGLLDRKLRVVKENTKSEDEWLTWTIRAFQSVYGFEFQGDNLLLARENMLYTFVDYIKEQLNREPTYKELKTIAEIITWNLWQMDGMKFTVPFCADSAKEERMTSLDVLEETQSESCYCKIRDWRSKKTVTYVSLIQKKGGI